MQSLLFAWLLGIPRVLQPASFKSLPTQWSEDYIPPDDSNVTPSAANAYLDPAVRFQPRRTVSVGPVGSASGTGGTRLSQSYAVYRFCRCTGSVPHE